ncbi:MAG: pirin family protein [Kurthia sp.]|nr:pirin family protein [Candidatus Kurthia equi]
MKIKSVESIPLQLGKNKQTRHVLQATEAEKSDPFVVLADDEFEHEAFPKHPHKGIQTVTYVLEGSLRHYDSQSQVEGELSAGDFQIMTAGRGIIHSEMPAENEVVRGLQLWVNLSSEHKKVAPNYQDLKYADVPKLTFDGGKIEIYAGSLEDVSSPLTLLTPFNYFSIHLKSGTSYKLPVPADFNSFIYVLEGEVSIAEELVQNFEFAKMGRNEAADEIQLTAMKDTHLVYFGGQPIREPIVVRGPFVMNTQAEMKSSYADFRNGDFLGGAPY